LSSNNTCFNGISKYFLSNCCWFLSSKIFGTHIIINSSCNSHVVGNSLSNLLDGFGLCIGNIFSCGISSISSIGNFLDGSSIFSSSSKSFFLCGLDLSRLSSIFSESFSDGLTSYFSGSNSSGNLNFSNLLSSFSLCKFSISAGFSWCIDSFLSNFFDGLSSCNCSFKSSILSGLYLSGLSIISSNSFNSRRKVFSCGLKLSSFFRGCIIGS